MKKALMGASAAAVIALAPLCIPPAQAHADDPCVSITDPAAHPACIDEFPRDYFMHRYQGGCQASPLYGQVGQVCRDFWVRKWNRGGGQPSSRQVNELLDERIAHIADTAAASATGYTVLNARAYVGAQTSWRDCTLADRGHD